jgi:SAM-dependent MidA family methyltransferase
MPNAAQIIRAALEKQAPIPFCRFMELALYAPDTGFYERDSGVIGRAGDFYTSVSAGSLFGELLACQFADWLEALPVSRCQIVEAGAHDGSLGADVLNWLGRNRPALLERWQYWIVEPSLRRQHWQREKLKGFSDQVRWFRALADLPAAAVTGVIFSNELLDAFPVRRLGWDAAQKDWFEWGVVWECDRFAWRRMPAPDAGEILSDCGVNPPPALLAVLPDGFTLDLCPAANAWWREAAAKLCCGKLLTIDYGLAAEQLLAPERQHGTLRPYRRHHIAPDPLADPGEQDLTAHVNFTALQRAGEAAGLRTELLCTQAQFLTRIAEPLWKDTAPTPGWTSEKTRVFQTLSHPEHLGRAFQVLVQSRDAPPAA